MKKIIIFSFIALILVIKVHAQNPIPEKNVFDKPTGEAHITKVLSAIISCDSVTLHPRTSPAHYNYFKATITGNITLSGTGTDYIYIEKSSQSRDPFNPFPLDPSIHYLISLAIDSPNQLHSNRIGPF